MIYIILILLVYYTVAQGFDALHSCYPEESFEVFDAIIHVQILFPFTFLT